MLREALIKSGIALVRTGIETLVNTGSAYLLDPDHGAQRRRQLWEGAHVALDRAESVSGALMHGLQKEAKGLRGLVRHATRWQRSHHGSAALPLAIAGVGVTLGAGLMFFLDPEHGAERRASLRERVNGACDAVRRVTV